MITITLFFLLFLFLFIGVPVAVSLGLSSVLVIAFLSHDSVSSVALQLFTASQKYTLLAIPFFILASSFMSTGGVASRIIRFSIALPRLRLPRVAKAGVWCTDGKICPPWISGMMTNGPSGHSSIPSVLVWALIGSP